MSLTRGAGVEGDREVLRGMRMGLRALEGIVRVAAVAPERRGYGTGLRERQVIGDSTGL